MGYVLRGLLAGAALSAAAALTLGTPQTARAEGAIAIGASGDFAKDGFAFGAAIDKSSADDAGEQALLAVLALAADALAQRHVTNLVVPQRVAAALCFQHQGECGVGVDVDMFDRVHLDRDLECACHGDPLRDLFKGF